MVTKFISRDTDTDIEDPLDLFDTSLSLIFAIPPIAFSSSSNGTYTYTNPALSAPIVLTLPSPPAELYTTLQANHVWLASVYLADQILLNRIKVNGQRVAELGAGAGLPGIVACLGGAEVISSDWDTPEVIGAIKHNFELRCGEERKWAVKGHTWGTDPSGLLQALSPDQPKQYDMLLLADTLWMTDAHSVLLDSIFALLAPGGTAHVAAGLHTGRGPVERFRAAARDRGGELSELKSVKWMTGGGWEDHIAPDKGFEEERGVVIYFTLRHST